MVGYFRFTLNFTAWLLFDPFHGLQSIIAFQSITSAFRWIAAFDLKKRKAFFDRNPRVLMQNQSLTSTPSGSLER
jgi:hypothetical protein